ncbi:SDR family NAD(P)-dependent oxidoreductase [Pseudarthrobacter sp. NamE2]|uniref:SDR family NAD(P)-dependent oxidoreductase n=1 Tax=Pseudarthrobacter sp. NamE2 TaxID=2576838 RepID=UPI001484FF43
MSLTTENIRRDLRPVTILVNAAGTDVPGTVEKLEAADWDRVMNVNLREVFLLARAVFPGMRDAGCGMPAGAPSSTSAR